MGIRLIGILLAATSLPWVTSAAVAAELPEAAAECPEAAAECPESAAESPEAAAESPEAVAIAEVCESGARLLTAFNAGSVDEVSAIFLPDGELVDEEGTVNQGEVEIKELLTAFFEKFPGAKLSTEMESVRVIGPIAIEDGTRTITIEDGSVTSQFRYIAVWSKSDRGWQLASCRDIADDPAPTPHEFLEPLAWLEGEWMNEGADGKVAIDFRWSEDKNFLLGTFEINPADAPPRRSVQRIGWDPAACRIRSWLFDADGGFSDGYWTVVDEEVVIKSSCVNPDGSTASATLTLLPAGTDRFTISGTDRIVGEEREEDFEINVVRRPPATKCKSE